MGTRVLIFLAVILLGACGKEQAAAPTGPSDLEREAMIALARAAERGASDPEKVIDPKYQLALQRMGLDGRSLAIRAGLAAVQVQIGGHRAEEGRATIDALLAGDVKRALADRKPDPVQTGAQVVDENHRAK
jgi:hypothetical protein